jgi:glycosyltransferase involved in cell wall biosynthesis
MKKSLSVVMSALNEEKNIVSAIDAMTTVLREEGFTDYEILVFNDGSSDRTGDLAQEAARGDSHIRVIHHAKSLGLAAIAREAVQIATKDYETWFPGDNSVDAESMRSVFRLIGQADIVSAYTANTSSRPFVRRALSRLFTFFINSLFQLHLKYYNGASVFPLKLLREIKIKSNGYGFFAEIYVRLLKLGYSYVEVPFCLCPQDGGSSSKAFSLKNVFYIFKTVAILFLDIYIRRNARG